MKHLLLLTLLFACAHEPEETPSSFDPKPLYASYVSRLPEFTEGGWIVSRKPDGSAEHVGDSLLWTGLAMAALPCEEGTLYADTMRKMIEENDGALIRFSPLPARHANGDEISFDGASGLYFGILARLLRCADRLEEWSTAWHRHTAYLERNFGYLHANTRVAVQPEFTVLPDLIGYYLDQRGKPHTDRMRALEVEATAWVYAVKLSKEPCFRVHLAWLYMRSLERANELSVGGKKRFCGAADNMGIPLIDAWCGFASIDQWDFVENAYEYRHQRCNYETENTGDLRTPGLDLILAYSEELP